MALLMSLTSDSNRRSSWVISRRFDSAMAACEASD